jgi:multisubunit Na+/H+ antiporter MnhG subunit
VTESAVHQEASPTRPISTGPPRTRARTGLRWTAAGLLLVLAALLLLAALLSRYARSQVLDTDRYVETVAPLASDPAIQQEITDQVTEAIFARVDVQALAEDALANVEGGQLGQVGDGALAQVLSALVTRLAPVIANQLENVTREQVGRFVASDQFAGLWVDVNRGAHNGLVAVLTGEGDRALTESSNGTVSVNLGPIVETVRQRLIDRGFSIAERIPDVDAQFVIFQSDELTRAQDLTARLNRWATWLPWVALLVMLAAVLVAPNRRRALLILGCVIVLLMLLLAIAVRVGRAAYLDGVPPEALSQPAAAVVFDTMVAPLQQAGWAVLAVGAVLIVGAYLAGPSALAQVIRRPVDRLLPEPVPGSVGELARHYRFGLTAFVLLLGGAVLLLWRYPTALVVIGVAVLILALLVLIRWLAGPSVPAPAVAGGAAPP